MKTKFARLAPLAGAALVLAALGAPATAADTAESARIRELERKLERSMQMIEELSGKVKLLEQAGTGASAGGGAQQNARIDELQKQVGDLTAASSRRGADDGLPVHGFADVGLRRNNENNAQFGKGAKGFTVGSLDLYLTPQFGDRVKSLLELVFEVDREGGLATDLERAQMGYTFSDALTAWAGRFHTPYGYWNTAFHHGQQIQTSASRPRFLDFEDAGGILPAHTTGAWLTGSLPLGGSKFGYDAYIGNAPRIANDPGATTGALTMKMGGGSSHYPTTGFNVSLRPGALSDLTLGLHGQRGTVQDDNGNDTRLNMFGGYGVFNNDSWEVMSEYYRFRNRDLSGGTGSHRSSAWYAQAGYIVGAYTPYARFEKTRLDQTDNYFLSQASGRSYRRSALGLRYDVNAKAAVKLELNRTRQGDIGPGLADDNYSEARFQYAIRF